LRLQALYTYNAAVAEFDRATATEVKYSACVDEPGTRSKLRTAAKPTPAPKPTPLPLNGDCAPAKVMRTGTKVESSLAKSRYDDRNVSRPGARRLSSRIRGARSGNRVVA